MQTEFLDLGFEKCFFAKDMRSIAGQFTKNNRCGIYILRFSNGQYYVGLAIDVVNRYAQHRLNHLDIEHVSFKEVIKPRLFEAERETIFKLENLKKSLRNINIVSVVSGETDLDLLVSPEEQNKWLKGEVEIEGLNTKRFDYPELRKKHTSKFQKLQKHILKEEIFDCLWAYVILTIPFFKKTEYSFWSVSCLPATNKNNLVRFNIFRHPKLVVSEYKINEHLSATRGNLGLEVLIWLAKSIVDKSFTEKKLKKKFRTLE